MFFALSKILSFVISPIVWVFCLLIAALIKKNAIAKRKFLLIGLLFLFIFSNGAIQNEIFRLWEIPATKLSETGHHKIGIVLGGVSWHDSDLDRIQFVRGGDRLFQAIDLYKNNYIEKILFTSGSGQLTKPEEIEAIPVKKYLLSIGIPDSAIVIESGSKNTYENALYSAKIIKDLNVTDTCLLITSALHMRRGMQCFEKLNVPVKAFSTDRYTAMREFNIEMCLMPSAFVLLAWDILMHEWIGFIAYKAMQYC